MKREGLTGEHEEDAADQREELALRVAEAHRVQRGGHEQHDLRHHRRPHGRAHIYRVLFDAYDTKQRDHETFCS